MSSSIEYHLSSCLISNGPLSMSIRMRNLPRKSSGTRHEYRQTPPQPYSIVWVRAGTSGIAGPHRLLSNPSARAENKMDTVFRINDSIVAGNTMTPQTPYCYNFSDIGFCDKQGSQFVNTRRLLNVKRTPIVFNGAGDRPF